MADDSWDAEFGDFLEDIRARRASPLPGLRDADRGARNHRHRSIGSPDYDHHP